MTDWIRKPEEFDYIVEPDIFHDLFGHVPCCSTRCLPTTCSATARAAWKAHALGACELLSRLYWYTIEFGLIRQPDGLRAYGAGYPQLVRRAALRRDQPRAAAYR